MNQVRPDADDLPHTEWRCKKCNAMNSCLDATCQYCDSEEEITPLTDAEMTAIARSNIEQHLDVQANEYDNAEALADAIAEEAYTLGFDALVDADVDHLTAARIAGELAQAFAGDHHANLQ